MSKVRIILRRVLTIMPHGEGEISYETVLIDSEDLYGRLTHASEPPVIVGGEVVKEDAPEELVIDADETIQLTANGEGLYSYLWARACVSCDEMKARAEAAEKKLEELREKGTKLANRCLGVWGEGYVGREEAKSLAAALKEGEE